MKKIGFSMALATLVLTGCYDVEQDSTDGSHGISGAMARQSLGGRWVAHVRLRLSLSNHTATVACDYLVGDKQVPLLWNQEVVLNFVSGLEEDCLAKEASQANAYRRLNSEFLFAHGSAEWAEFESVVTLYSGERILLNEEYQPQRRATLALDTLVGDHSHTYPARNF